MDIRSAIARNLHRRVLDYGKPLAKFSEDFDIPLTSLKSYVKGEANLRADSIDLLARKLDVTPAALLSDVPFGGDVAGSAFRAAVDVSLWPRERRERLASLFLELAQLISEAGSPIR